MGKIYDGFQQENGREIARRMLLTGMTDENLLQTLSGLSLEEIRQLKKEVLEKE